MADKGGIRMILADKITEERKKNGWSQEELADKLGVSRQGSFKIGKRRFDTGFAEGNSAGTTI